MTTAKQTVDRYFDIWNETEPAARRALIEQTWSERALYLDPLLSGEGQDGIDKMVEAVQAQYPGYRFERTSPVDEHHDRVRFSWILASRSDAEPLVSGVDFGVVAADGRLEVITGFFDNVPQASSE